METPDGYRQKRLNAAIRYAVAVGVVALVFLLDQRFDPFIDRGSLFLLLSMAVIAAAWVGGTGPALVATVTGAVLAAVGEQPSSDRGFDALLALFLLQGLLLTAILAELSRARLRAEEHARIATAARQEAEGASRLKDEFLATISHELRTPLNAILGFSDILAGEYFGKLENDRQREYVALINQSGAHLLSVVNTMLDMSKIEAGRYELMPEPFRVSEVVNACEAMLGLQAREKGVQLTSRMMRTVGEVNADQRALQQILINLVGNAIKFTDRGGLVTIDAEVSGSDLKLTVSDTGIGIAESQLATLGQPFVQIQNDYTRRYEGTGLGLSLVKGLVALHGGQFDLRSRAGEGTVITVTIPLDGSGIRVADEHEVVEQTMVEFPPRLKERTGKTTNGRVFPDADRSDVDVMIGGAGHDGSQAKTA
jgi:cell cycle sensor histidine kinase DivJ